MALEAWRLQSLRATHSLGLNMWTIARSIRAYRECLFTVYPSLMEGFGLPILESLWHGKPCVCGGNSARLEVARGGGCLTVDQTSENAIAAGIKNCSEIRQLMRDYAQKREPESFVRGRITSRSFSNICSSFSNDSASDFLRSETSLEKLGIAERLLHRMANPRARHYT